MHWGAIVRERGRGSVRSVKPRDPIAEQFSFLLCNTVFSGGRCAHSEASAGNRGSPTLLEFGNFGSKASPSGIDLS